MGDAAGPEVSATTLSPTARRMLDHFATPAKRTRHLIVLRDALGLPLCRDAAAALDELYAAKLIRIARNGRLLLTSRR